MAASNGYPHAVENLYICAQVTERIRPLQRASKEMFSCGMNYAGRIRRPGIDSVLSIDFLGEPP